jgi:hypothetical protein
MTDYGWAIPIYGLLVYALGVAIGRHSRRPRGILEYGARDPDDHDKIHAHANLGMARDAADWWRIDGKVYVRRVTDWKVTDD